MDKDVTTLLSLRRKYPSLEMWCERLQPWEEAPHTRWFYWVKRKDGSGRTRECTDITDLRSKCEHLMKEGEAKPHVGRE